MTVEDDRIERAARLAWEAFAAGNGHADELWRHQRPERQARWREIARAVLVFFEPTEEVERLESQLNGLRRAYDHACAQRDKYMRRTAEWRSAAVDGWDLPEDILADMQWADDDPDDDDADVRACTGCGTCLICAALPRGLCGNRADHAPHLHDSAGLGRFWCDADQSKRLPFAMERKAGQP